MKKLLSFFMALCLIASLGSVTAFAATDVDESTIIGERSEERRVGKECAA